MYRHNRALSSTAGAFSPQLDQSKAAGTAVFVDGVNIPTGCEVREDGSAVLRIHAPRASTVQLMSMTGPQTFTRREDGVWELEVEQGSGGFRPLMLMVDGTSVMSPLLPIGYGASRATNYLDLPRPGDAGALELCVDVPHGAVTQEIYWSGTTRNWESCLVYTPPGYQKSTEDYPVLYLQHGHGENERCWVYQGKINFILDNLISQGRAKPCIVVMNNGMVPCTIDGEFAARPALLPELLINDCIPFIENTYRCKTDRLHRAMAGLSMGSQQTSITVLDHPELFAWAGIFSGFLNKLPPIDPTPNTHMEALNDPEKVKASYKLFYRAIGAEDHFNEIFTQETALMASHSLSPEDWPAHRIEYFTGSHEWNVWRDCAKAFLQLVFQED